MKKSFAQITGEDIVHSFIQEASAFEFGIPPEHGGVRNALDNAKRLLSEYGLDGKIVAGGEIPVLRVFGDPQSVLKWAAQVGPDTYAEDYSVEDLEKEHAVGMKREMGERHVIDEVLMVRTQKTKDGKSYEWLVQKVLHNDTKTVASGTESSRARAAAAGKKAKKGLKEAVSADQIGKILKKYRTDFAKFKKGKTSLGDPGMENFYNALFDYFVGSGEMPYGTAKARSGDPLEWIEDRLMDEGTSARQRGEVQSPRSEKEYDALSPKDKKIVDARIKKARNTKPEGRPRVKGKTPSRRGGKITWEETKKNVGIELSEELAYLQSKDGKKTFVIAPRDTRGMRGKQDKFSMFIVDSKTGKKIEDLGSHVSLKGAIKFALKRGFIKEKEKVDARGLRSWGAVGEMNEAAPPKASKGMELKSVKREYEKLMKKWGNTPITKIPFKEFSKIRELGDKLMGTPKDAGLKVGDLLKHMKEAFTPKDPYTVKYYYDPTGRVMVAVLDGKKDAQKFLKSVKNLGMDGAITKGSGWS